MTRRIFNFSSGPAVLPLPVLQRGQREMLSYMGTGMSVMEMSHRSTEFGRILHDSEIGIRRLLNVPGNYRVLFLQGGATLQFSMIPMNFLHADGLAEYVITGAWGKKAFVEAKRFGNARINLSTESGGFKEIPTESDLEFDQNADFIHYTSNETIDGVEFDYELNGHGTDVVCDASSNILSKPLDVENFSLIYAGAQKNIGPSGVTLVIIRDSMLERRVRDLPPLLDYRLLAENDSMLNTPNTWGIYMMGLVCEWLEEQGGLAGIRRYNKAKAALLYEAIDGSDGFYSGHAAIPARSLMNVTFRLPTEELDEEFCQAAEARDLYGLRGHRTVGGVRASIYNAFPIEGIERLVDFMKTFQANASY